MFTRSQTGLKKKKKKKKVYGKKKRVLDLKFPHRCMRHRKELSFPKDGGGKRTMAILF